MKYLFTPASERALRFASGWTLCTDGIDSDELTPQALLLGLLSEPECRAATILVSHGIDSQTVRDHWAALAENDLPTDLDSLVDQFSKDVQVSLQVAEQRLVDLPQPLELATEHILLGLIDADHEVALWLRNQGLDPNLLDTNAHRLYGRPQPPARAGAISLPEQNAAGLISAPSTEERMADDSSSVGVLRVLDAAANRAREAMRVIEDFVRFVLDDSHLTGLCKQLRHDLTAALARLPVSQRLAARETQADVGTELTLASESRRDNSASVLAANFARLQESMRSLEEFGKVVDGELGEMCKQIRYRVYTLHRAMEITRNALGRLAAAQLYVLIDGCRSSDGFSSLVNSLVAAGVDLLQLRDKKLDDRTLLDRARQLRSLTAGTKTLMIVNDRPDLARLAQADGVHVGQEELSVKDTRTIVGADALVGVSTHSIEQARQAVLDGASYIGVGPTFPSSTKQFERFPGIDLLRDVASEIRLPAFAIGGIDQTNLAQVLSAGFCRVAVSRAVTGAKAPEQAARELLAALKPLQPVNAPASPTE